MSNRIAVSLAGAERGFLALERVETLPAAKSEDQTLATYASVLWRRKLMIILIVVIPMVLMVAIDTVRTREYAATASMQLVSQNVTQGNGTVPLQPTDIATDIQLVQSAAVKALVASGLGQPAPDPSVTEVGVTEVVNVTVSATEPGFAARAANEYVKAYIKFTSDRFATQIQEQETILQAQQATLQAQISEIEAQIAQNGSTSASNAALNTRLGNYSSQLQSVNSSLTQLQLDQTQVPSGALPVSPAVPDSKPTSPKPVLDALLAGFVGLIVGVCLALLLDFFDDRIRTKEGLELVSGGLPLLGEIPLFENWKDQPEGSIIAAVRPKSSAAEAYRSLRTSIQFIGFDSERPKVIQITSPVESEGKTTTAVDLAVTMASGGTRVALVSCDLRRPRIHDYFVADNARGLSTLLSGADSLEDVIVVPKEFPNLIYIPSGPVPPNPSELLGSKRLAQTFETLRGTNDIILVDGPPVLPVTDAVVIAQVVDSVIVLVRAGRTRRRAVSRALETLSNVDAPLEGVILNAVTPESASYGYRYGGYRYGGPSDASPLAPAKSSS